MAIGSRRITPAWPVAAAVVSEPIEAPTSTPWAQSRASNTSGTSDARRPPNTIAEIGPPCAAPACGEYGGHRFALTVKRELGCAALPLPATDSPPCPSLARQRSPRPFRTDRRRVGEGCVRTFRFLWVPVHYKKK